VCAQRLLQYIKARLLSDGSLCSRIVECLYKRIILYIVTLRTMFLVVCL
jgi:hypothetical protein